MDVWLPSHRVTVLSPPPLLSSMKLPVVDYMLHVYVRFGGSVVQSKVVLKVKSIKTAFRAFNVSMLS